MHSCSLPPCEMNGEVLLLLISVHLHAFPSASWLPHRSLTFQFARMAASHAISQNHSSPVCILTSTESENKPPTKLNDCTEDIPQFSSLSNPLEQQPWSCRQAQRVPLSQLYQYERASRTIAQVDRPCSFANTHKRDLNSWRIECSFRSTSKCFRREGTFYWWKRLLCYIATGRYKVVLLRIRRRCIGWTRDRWRSSYKTSSFLHRWWGWSKILLPGRGCWYIERTVRVSIQGRIRALVLRAWLFPSVVRRTSLLIASSVSARLRWARIPSLRSFTWFTLFVSLIARLSVRRHRTLIVNSSIRLGRSIRNSWSTRLLRLRLRRAWWSCGPGDGCALKVGTASSTSKNPPGRQNGVRDKQSYTATGTVDAVILRHGPTPSLQVYGVTWNEQWQFSQQSQLFTYPTSVIRQLSHWRCP